MLSFPPDATFVVQFVSFFILLALLHRWLFLPFLEVIEERERRTAGARASADSDRRQAEQARERIERELAETRLRAAARAEEIRRQTRREEREIFAEAERRASERLAELRGGIEREAERAAQELRAQAQTVAARMVAALLDGRGN